LTRAGVPIGVAAIRSGVKVPTIRYYEEIGLLARTNSNRRHYSADDLRPLVFIRRARQLGFEIDAIRALLPFKTTKSCEAVDDIARARFRAGERRIEDLLKLKAELERMIADCSRRRVAECRIIEVLASPDEVIGREQSEMSFVGPPLPTCALHRVDRLVSWGTSDVPLMLSAQPLVTRN
jgi:DNA-binding transcriptional MerR regulator